MSLAVAGQALRQSCLAAAQWADDVVQWADIAQLELFGAPGPRQVKNHAEFRPGSAGASFPAAGARPLARSAPWRWSLLYLAMLPISDYHISIRLKRSAVIA